MTLPAPSLYYRKLTRRIRPARVVTVVPRLADEWQFTALRMMENYSVTWGGVGDLLVPADAAGEVHPAIWSLIEIFDADTWATYVSTLRGFELANPSGFDSWMDEQARAWGSENNVSAEEARRMLTEDHMMRSARGGWPPNEHLQAEILRRTAPALGHEQLVFAQFKADSAPGHHLVDVRDLRPLPGRVRQPDTSGLPLSLQVLAAARFGGLAPAHATGLAEAGVEIELVALEESDLASLLRLAWFGEPSGTMRILDQLMGPDPTSLGLLEQAPMRLSSVGCARMTRHWHTEVGSPVVVVGDHVDDFCYSLALDRCGVPSLWLPMEFADGSSGISTVVLETLASGLLHADGSTEETNVCIQSLSLGDLEVEEVAQRLAAASWGPPLGLHARDSIGLPPYRLPSLLDPECYDDPLDEPFEGDAMARSVPSAFPSGVTAGDPWKLTWWFEVNEPGSPLPSRSALNDLVIVDEEPWRATTRCGRDGISYFSHSMGFIPAGATREQMINRPRLRFPSVRSVFDRLFSHAGYHANESPAGRFRRLSTSLWGSLSELAADLERPEVLALLRGWSSTEPSDVEPGVLGGRHRFLSFDDSVRMSGLPDDEVRDLLDRYITRGILRRGLVLKCEHCLFLDWYDLSELGQHFSCRRCLTSTVITQPTWRRGAEPAPYYDLAEVVQQALRANFEVPVRVLAKLLAEARSFAETPEMEVTDPEGRKIELDLLAIADGRIVLGEAKTGDRLKATAASERDWLNRFARVARDICADEVVFGTAADAWQSATAGRIESAFRNGHTTSVRLLTGC